MSGCVSYKCQKNDKDNSLFPGEVAHETEERDKDENEVENTTSPETWYNALVFSGKSNGWGNNGIEGKDEHRENKRPRDCCGKPSVSNQVFHRKGYRTCNGVLGPQTVIKISWPS